MQAMIYKYFELSSRVALLLDSNGGPARLTFPQAQEAAQALGMVLAAAPPRHECGPLDRQLDREPYGGWGMCGCWRRGGQ